MRKLLYVAVVWSLWPALISGHDLEFVRPIDSSDLLPYDDECFKYKAFVPGSGGYHLGDDYCTAHGDPVFASAFGRVLGIYPTAQSCGLGNTIILQHTLERPLQKAA
ncbi:MAG TPA: hypothetical protein VFR31_21115, partial [Thermoanaerobaculia bacterium]|nr:hypothetical protein [Thermoanaerobaculia bacterium]